MHFLQTCFVRLNLGAQPPAKQPQKTPPTSPVPAQPPALDGEARRKLHALQAAWLEASRHIAAKTEDVGEQFADQALRMHKGEEPERPIRGQASVQQAMELLEEGVPVMPLALPSVSKETLQ